MGKSNITRQDPNSDDDDDDFDTHVFMLRGNDEVILDDQDDTMMDPYWSQASSSAPDYDWNLSSFDLSEYFPFLSGEPSSPSTITLEDKEIKWRIEFDRKIKKYRSDHPEFDHGI